MEFNIVALGASTTFIKQYMGKDTLYIKNSTRQYILDNVDFFTPAKIYKIEGFIKQLEHIEKNISQNISKKNYDEFQIMKQGINRECEKREKVIEDFDVELLLS